MSPNYTINKLDIHSYLNILVKQIRNRFVLFVEAPSAAVGRAGTSESSSNSLLSNINQLQNRFPHADYGYLNDILLQVDNDVDTAIALLQ